MLNKNVKKILQNLAPSDIVLDIGGWAKPFARANYVIDVLPFETRGFYGKIGQECEHFSEKTWIIHDVSSQKPLPFKDKEIDYVVCSQVLEDIRDPIHLCSEMIRVGKKGYIETPSRLIESTIGVEGEHYTGYFHHRWLVEIENSEITFRFKPHVLNESPRYCFPKSFLRRLGDEDRVAWLFWDGNFKFKEIIVFSCMNVTRELQQFAETKKTLFNYQRTPRLQLSYLTTDLKRRAIARNVLERSPRTRKTVERLLRRKLGFEETMREREFWKQIPEIYSHD